MSKYKVLTLCLIVLMLGLSSTAQAAATASMLTEEPAAQGKATESCPHTPAAKPDLAGACCKKIDAAKSTTCCNDAACPKAARTAAVKCESTANCSAKGQACRVTVCCTESTVSKTCASSPKAGHCCSTSRAAASDTACNTACEDACEKTCRQACLSMCRESMRKACGTTCDDECIERCARECADACAKECAKQCTERCSAQCADSCRHPRGNPCGTAHRADCGNRSTECGETAGTNCMPHRAHGKCCRAMHSSCGSIAATQAGCGSQHGQPACKPAVARCTQVHSCAAANRHPCNVKQAVCAARQHACCTVTN